MANVTELTAQLAAAPAFNESIMALITATTDPIVQGLNTYFVLGEGFLVFMMQLGFALLTIGCVQRSSAKSVCVKNVLDLSFGVLGYYFFGWAFAYGDNTSCDAEGNCVSTQNAFIGSTQFAMQNIPYSSYHTWFFQYVFAISTATIVSGAVAERCTMVAYALYAFFLTAWVYPVLSHWVWSASGWISTTRTTGPLFLGTGAYDTVGSGAVHMLGGVAALMGAAIVGPRAGRFDENGKPRPMPGHNNVFFMAGTLLLWFGFYGFNPGTMGYLVLADGSAYAEVVARCVISTTLGGGFGAVTATLIYLAYTKLKTGHATWDLGPACNGALCGMIVITSGCATFQPWASAVGGIIGGIIYLPGSYFVLHILKVDDPVDATVVHFFSGAAGVIWYALMAEKDFVYALYGPTNPNGSERAYGWWRGDGPTVLWANIVWCFVIFGWGAFWMGGFFYLMKLCKLLRVDESEQLTGVDISHHGGSAYIEPTALMSSNIGKGGSLSKQSPNQLAEEIELLRADVASLTNKLSALEGAKA